MPCFPSYCAWSVSGNYVFLVCQEFVSRIIVTFRDKKLLGIVVLVLMLITSSQADDNIEIYLLNQLDDTRSFCIDIRGHKLKAKKENFKLKLI